MPWRSQFYLITYVDIVKAPYDLVMSRPIRNKEEFEYTKEVVRIRKSKQNRQHIG